MKVLFAGPSLYGAAFACDEITKRPPATQGDIAQAVLGGATAIGLVDGCFETIAAVWHKEILFALERNVAVLGAASIGALRAAECAPFGMQPVGDIALDYTNGALDDDAAVAVLHGPGELGYPPVTLALVDVMATTDTMLASAAVSEGTVCMILERAQALYFKERTLHRLFEGMEDSQRLLELYLRHQTFRKRENALALVEALKTLPSIPNSRPHQTWSIATPPHWRAAISLLTEKRSPNW